MLKDSKDALSRWSIMMDDSTIVVGRRNSASAGRYKLSLNWGKCVESGKTLTREYERQLIDRAKRAEALALRELIDHHKDRLFAFIWRMIHDHHEAEDICQDAFLKAFASLDTFSSEYRFSTWLFTIGYRVCLNRLRRKRGVSSEVDFTTFATAEVENESTDALVSADAAALRDAIWGAVDQLSPPQRAVVLLFYRQNMGCPEIAQIMQLPSATVKSHLHRARARLKELLAAQEFDGARIHEREAV